MRNHIQPGNTLTIPAPEHVLPGDVVQVGEIIGVVNGAAALGQPVDVDVVGCFTLPKVAADAIDLGDAVHWSGTLATATIADNPRLGVAIEDAPAGAPTVKVRLSGF